MKWLDDSDGCAGYFTETDAGMEFDCLYEFDGPCEDCIFGGGTQDPRQNREESEDEGNDEKKA